MKYVLSILLLTILILFLCKKRENFENLTDRENLTGHENFTMNDLKPNDTSSGGLSNIQKKKIEDIVQNQLQKAFNNAPIIPGPQGLPGQQGLRGSIGPSGGSYIGKGNIESIQYPDMVVDRMYGMGTNSKLYMGDKLPGATNQRWTMQSKEGKIVNHFNMKQCIKHSSNDVYMGNCKKTANNNWRYLEQDMTLRPADKMNMCLSVSRENKVPNESYKISKNKKREEISTSSKLMMLRLDPCTKPIGSEQKWLFKQ